MIDCLCFLLSAQLWFACKGKCSFQLLVACKTNSSCCLNGNCSFHVLAYQCSPLCNMHWMLANKQATAMAVQQLSSSTEHLKSSTEQLIPTAKQHSLSTDQVSTSTEQPKEQEWKASYPRTILGLVNSAYLLVLVQDSFNDESRVCVQPNGVTMHAITSAY